MPRYQRLFLPHMPLHIVQRGHDRQPVFVERADYQYYLDNLRDMAPELSIRVHAYCLMTNRAHLLVAPTDATENVSKLMRVLAGRQTRYVNKLEKRTGTLWEGRFKASLVESERYLLSCYRYIDLNPVRAGIVANPRDYEWSSYRQHAVVCNENWLDTSDAFLALGMKTSTRSAAYTASDKQINLARYSFSIESNLVTANDLSG
jgi:putative transposase